MDGAEQFHALQHTTHHGDVVIQLPRRLADHYVQLGAHAAVFGIVAAGTRSAVAMRKPCLAGFSDRVRRETRRRSPLPAPSRHCPQAGQTAGPSCRGETRQAGVSSPRPVAWPWLVHRHPGLQTAPRNYPARDRCWCRPRNDHAQGSGCCADVLGRKGRRQLENDYPPAWQLHVKEIGRVGRAPGLFRSEHRRRAQRADSGRQERARVRARHHPQRSRQTLNPSRPKPSAKRRAIARSSRL